MSDDLYPKPVLRLAASAAGAGRLAPHDREGMAHNPVCGDRVSVTLRLDADGRIAELAHETRACVLAQASAAILGARLKGATDSDIAELRAAIEAMLAGGVAPAAPFADYEALKGVAAYRGRHACVLLPVRAIENALKSSYD